MFNRRIAPLAFMLFTASFGSSSAQEGHHLTIVTADGVEHIVDLEDLDAMEQVEFSTETIWTEGLVRFSGVPVRRLLESVEAEGNTLRLSALNDYVIEMPTMDLEEDAPIVATRMDGETMSVREKGPYWIVYPFDRSRKYRTEAKYSQSVWQLKMLTVTE